MADPNYQTAETRQAALDAARNDFHTYMRNSVAMSGMDIEWTDHFEVPGGEGGGGEGKPEGKPDGSSGGGGVDLDPPPPDPPDDDPDKGGGEGEGEGGEGTGGGDGRGEGDGYADEGGTWWKQGLDGL